MTKSEFPKSWSALCKKKVSAALSPPARMTSVVAHALLKNPPLSLVLAVVFLRAESEELAGLGILILLARNR